MQNQHDVVSGVMQAVAVGEGCPGDSFSVVLRAFFWEAAIPGEGLVSALKFESVDNPTRNL